MKISQEKKKKISEQILAYLYERFPEQQFTSQIAQELARDEEFIKRMLVNLQERGFVTAIKKNSRGIVFLRRIKWQLSTKAYNAYHEKARNMQ